MKINDMFKGSKPMSGMELKILKQTAKRLISKEPTSLAGGFIWEYKNNN